MKEQKELIEAALALVDALEEKGWFECPEEARLTNAAEAYRKAQKEGRRKAPWKDCYGTVLFEGDIVQDEEDGGIGEILFNDKYKGSQHQWFIKYEGDQHSSNLFNRVRYPGLRKIGNNFAEVYVEESQAQPHKAPWKDSEGNVLFDGDEVRFPDGETLTLEYRQRDDWGARNSDGVWLPIGFLLTERAVKVSP